MPDPNITHFISQFEGGARANRFEVIMTFPGSVPNEMEKMSFSCKIASIPGSSVSKVEVPYMSRMIAVAGDRTVADWTLTIINDADFAVREAFEIWLDKINAHEGNKSASGWNVPTSYYGQATVSQFDREDRLIKSYFLKDIFPTDLQEISLDWGSNNTIEEFTVTLAVNWWSDRNSD
jgi:hypothetical protein